MELETTQKFKTLLKKSYNKHFKKYNYIKNLDEFYNLNKEKVVKYGESNKNLYKNLFNSFYNDEELEFEDIKKDLLVNFDYLLYTLNNHIVFKGIYVHDIDYIIFDGISHETSSTIYDLLYRFSYDEYRFEDIFRNLIRTAFKYEISLEELMDMYIENEDNLFD